MGVGDSRTPLVSRGPCGKSFQNCFLMNSISLIEKKKNNSSFACHDVLARIRPMARLNLPVRLLKYCTISIKRNNDDSRSIIQISMNLIFFMCSN